VHSMKQVLMAFLTLWVLLLSPGLCLSGVLEHFCADNPAGTSCEHENDCSSDPCGKVLLVHAPDPSKSNAAPVIHAIVEFVESLDLISNKPPVPVYELWPHRVNLPVPPADLPLLS
jgi:hypothetical protein